MVDITYDHKKAVTVLEMNWGPKRVIVHLTPSRHTPSWFDLAGAYHGDGRKIKDSSAYDYHVQAEKELKAHLLRTLKTESRPTHVQVMNLGERVELAFYNCLHQQSTDGLAALRPIGAKDLKALQDIQQKLVKEVVAKKIQCRSDGTPEPTDLWYQVKGQVVDAYQKKTGINQTRRDFYSSVLGTALGWKQNRVPFEVYELANRLRAGARLMFSVQ